MVMCGGAILSRWRRTDVFGHNHGPSTMGLIPGTRLGPCEIVSAIGAGGMGEVYRARDTRLNRDVAIKVLPDLFALAAERLAPVTREAHTLAYLHHPNIPALYRSARH